MTSATPDDRAAVDKAISLLVAFREQGSTGLGVSELARRSQMSKSTAYRVLGMLERNGVVERTGTDYRLGARLHELGRTVYAPGHEQLRDLLLPFLTDLYEVTRQTVHLAALHGSDVVYLAKLYGHRPVPSPSRIGGTLPAYCTAVGKALLAYETDPAVSGPLLRLTPHTVADTEALAAELDRVRTEGVAYDDEESQPGLICVAAPVFGLNGRAIAALSVAGRKGDSNVHQRSGDLRRITAAASQALRAAQWNAR